MKIIDYYKREYDRISEMLQSYTEYGYTPELSDLVEILSQAKKKLVVKILELQKKTENR